MVKKMLCMVPLAGLMVLRKGGTMKLWKIALAFACAFGFAQLARSQEAGQTTASPLEQGIAGYFNPRTGAFKPMVRVPLDESEIETATVSGDFKVTITITLKSSLPSNASISCNFDASTTDVTSFLTVDDNMTVAATGSGSTRTCSLDMFYAWNLASASSDTVGFTYYVIATSTGTTGTLNRFSDQTLASTKGVPSGTTTKTITATL